MSLTIEEYGRTASRFPTSSLFPASTNQFDSYFCTNLFPEKQLGLSIGNCGDCYCVFEPDKLK